MGRGNGYAVPSLLLLLLCFCGLPLTTRGFGWDWRTIFTTAAGPASSEDYDLHGPVGVPDNTSSLTCKGTENSKETVIQAGGVLPCSIQIRRRYHRTLGSIEDFNITLRGNGSAGVLSGFALARNDTVITFNYEAPDTKEQAEIIVRRLSEMIVGSPVLVRVYYHHKPESDWASLSPGAIMLVSILSVFGFALMMGTCFIIVGKLVEQRNHIIYRYKGGGGRTGMSIVVDAEE